MFNVGFDSHSAGQTTSMKPTQIRWTHEERFRYNLMGT